MTTEHDEALVERVAQSMCSAWRGTDIPADGESWRDKARAVIYPPAPPKTRLEVARELLAAGHNAREAESGTYDNTPAMKAILAALALPAMED